MAQLSISQPIDDLSAVKALQTGHPVYLLVADDDSHLVIKKESTQDMQNLRRNQLAMRIASPQSRSEILDQNELDTLKNFIAFQRLHARWGGGTVSADVAALARDLAAGGTWFKMQEAKGLLNLAGVARQVLQGDKSGSRALAKALNQSGGLEALGRIVGADLFNHNGDRFLPDYGVKTFIRTDTGEHSFDCKALVNVGNVMAAISHGKLTAIGLDSWDPSDISAQESDMNRVVSKTSWLGGLLAPDRKADRLRFATDICHDLNLLLGERNRRFKFLQQTRLGSDAPQRVATGMEWIRKRLIDKLEASIKRPNPAAGLASRLQILRGV
jgi:hypothetical protein